MRLLPVIFVQSVVYMLFPFRDYKGYLIFSTKATKNSTTNTFERLMKHYMNDVLDNSIYHATDRCTRPSSDLLLMSRLDQNPHTQKAEISTKTFTVFIHFIHIDTVKYRSSGSDGKKQKELHVYRKFAQ